MNNNIERINIVRTFSFVQLRYIVNTYIQKYKCEVGVLANVCNLHIEPSIGANLGLMKIRNEVKADHVALVMIISVPFLTFFLKMQYNHTTPLCPCHSSAERSFLICKFLCRTTIRRPLCRKEERGVVQHSPMG